MSLLVRKAGERGHVNLGWLDSFHSFSFGSYYDSDFMGFGNLRVINDDIIEAGMGFGTHPHDNMEIVTYIIDGELEHKDSEGNGSVMKKGDVQLMSAGSGIAHSEFNHSKENRVHLLQIWILPDVQGLAPSYQQEFFEVSEKRNKLKLVVSSDGKDGSLEIKQDASIYASILESGKKLEFDTEKKVWIQLVRGTLKVNDKEIDAGDAVYGEMDWYEIEALNEAEFLLFEV